MNFKRYHISTNLFDKNTTPVSLYYQTTREVITQTAGVVSIIMLVSPNTTYTFNNPTGNRNRICETETVPKIDDTVINYIASDGNVSITLTTSSNTHYILWWVGYQQTYSDIKDTLSVNLGSKALPYEPYGNTWTDIPHYVHNTSTDTLTTLPAVVYPNAETATVGLKGQAVQSSVPSPTSPVMPQGTGERTGNLWDEEYPNISETIRYIPLYVGEGSFTLSTTTPYAAGVANVFLLSGNVSSGASTPNNGAWLKHKVTAQSDDGYVTIAYRHYTGTTSPVDFQTMLNTGSTALPYEPYGYKIPISSGGVNLFDKDNADIVDLYPDATTREIKQSSNLSTWSIVLPVEPSTTYTFTMGEVTTAIRRRVGMCSDYPTKGAYCTSVDDTPEYDHPNLGNIFTTDADTRYVLIMYVSGAGRDVAIERANRVQVVKGNTALPYEPYNRATTNIYLGEVETTRKIKKLVLDGTETGWTKSGTYQGSFFAQVLTNINITANTEPVQYALCSHAQVVKLANFANGTATLTGNTTTKSINLWIGESEWTVDEFKSYLAAQYAAGTPVTIWYVLAEPTTGIVNEPLRKIGDYADTVSGITIPTIAGTNALSIGTTLQPSEVSVNYKGWHPVADVHERENGAWT